MSNNKKVVFVTGATGFVGSRVVRQLLSLPSQPFHILALCRSSSSSDLLLSLGAEPVFGDVKEPEKIAEIAKRADVILHLAFIHDFSKFLESIAIEFELVKALHKAVAGTNKHVIITSGTLMFGPTQPGKPADDTHTPTSTNGRAAVDKYALENNMTVIRLPPFVYGHNGAGFATVAIQIAKKHGVSVYFDDGSAKLSSVHVDDAAHAYVLALEKGRPGQAYHAVYEGVTFKDFATAIGKLQGLETKSISLKEGPSYHGDFFSFIFSANHEATATKAEKELGWKPTNKPSIIDDIANGSYKAF